MDESSYSKEERDAVSDALRAKVPTVPIAQYFAFGHLKQPLADVSFAFARLALFTLENTPRNPEQTVALRKLLEAKDAAVRARLTNG